MSSKDVPKYVQENYNVVAEIAKGKFGVVYRCTEKATNSFVAIKVMKGRHNKKDDVEREVAIMRQLSHPNILQFIDYVPDKTSYILVTELLNGGELFDYCVTKDYVEEAEAVFFMKQILSGLEYMHKRDICHLDLKPENIVLKDESAKELKIIDFGTCQHLTKDKAVKALAGTPEFVAPEVLNYDPVTCAADMWAIGVIAFCLLTGCSPFLGDNDAETIQNVTEGEFEFPESDPEEGYDDITDAAKDFISSLLISDPRKRLTSIDAQEHKWINGSTSQAARINTERLKKLRRRRKLLAAIQAVRLSVGLLRSFTRHGSVSVEPAPDRRMTEPSIRLSTPPSSAPATNPGSFMANGSASYKLHVS
ncbi:PREDICTED: death-associated protein kinase 2-like [Amphimedon queenslandica]|uniref:Protein kinase domain-containing protein n=1 Tax=Amphimedon queenslandica TaxID=400682 RepID=A0A1X7VWR3_AMPQE|nr:PREDICTED: death-associated protein kinase 2-like [Amphimedon queenslandica]|eukprot:XP_003382394.1 PREDICTED: death-associated protein kinase 2-like [Amphimedon queenslandica]